MQNHFFTTKGNEQLLHLLVTYNVVPPPQESMDNGPSLFNYGLDDPYNDLIDDFDLYLEYGEEYQNRTAFKDAFYNNGAATQLTRGVTHTMTHNDSQ